LQTGMLLRKPSSTGMRAIFCQQFAPATDLV
jgi:hypothetical protein